MLDIEIVEGPHVLFRGGNGQPTAGITVRSTRPVEEVERKGYQREWGVNTYSLRHFLSHLDLSETEIDAFIRECMILEGRNPYDEGTPEHQAWEEGFDAHARRRH